jgi:hypothetical protein
MLHADRDLSCYRVALKQALPCLEQMARCIFH